MYLPTHFREDRLEAQHALIRAHPLGLLVTAGANGLLADPLPFLIDAADGPLGTLRAHCARANPHWQRLADAAEALVVFQGPAAYVTPSWYATKAANGKVVPTWNYLVVQARGRPRVFEDAAWLRHQVGRLTDTMEQGRSEPWAVDDAPESFVAAQLRAIVGIEIPIARLDGKWKASQNRAPADRAGVAAGLAAEADPSSMPMARIVAGCPA